eukprot:2712794-Prymnesium_polylepis.1
MRNFGLSACICDRMTIGAGGQCWPPPRGIEELYAHLWGLRVAEHVAASCEGPWHAWSLVGVDPAGDFRSHRDWCPRFAGTWVDPNAEANSYSVVAQLRQCTGARGERVI